jgi:hypothetical protein
MKGSKTTRAASLRAERQEDHRKRLSEGQHLRHVIENIENIEKLEVDIKGGAEDDNNDLQLKQFTLSKLKTAADLRLKLVDKYLPNLKAVEHTGEGGGTIKIEEWLEQLE